jgi:hypothetical protein
MDLDEEILQRLVNTEDHFTERKSAPHQEDCTKADDRFRQQHPATQSRNSLRGCG